MHARLQVLRLNTTQQVAAQRDSTLPRNEMLHPGGNGRDVAPEASARTSERTSEASARRARTSKRSDGAQRIAESTASRAQDSTTLRCLHPMYSRARVMPHQGPPLS